MDIPTRLVLSVGGVETDGFKNQTRAYETACESKGLPVTRVDAPHCNHFNLLRELADPRSELLQTTLQMMGQPSSS